MRLKISTSVAQDYRSVMRGFTQDLFLNLNPPFPPVQLLRFDGCKEGDIVSLELDFIFFKQQWTSIITEDHLNDHEFRFVDMGTKLPFFLKYWKHRHLILKDGHSAKIVDDISFSSPWPPLDLILWPVLWLQFLYRKPIYKKVFKKM